MAIKTFADQITSDIFHGLNTKFSRRIPQRVWTAARRRLDLLNKANSMADLNAHGLHLEPLKYTLPGFYSIRVNDQYRVLFQWQIPVEGTRGDAYQVQISDYHGR